MNKHCLRPTLTVRLAMQSNAWWVELQWLRKMNSLILNEATNFQKKKTNRSLWKNFKTACSEKAKTTIPELYRLLLFRFSIFFFFLLCRHFANSVLHPSLPTACLVLVLLGSSIFSRQINLAYGGWARSTSSSQKLSSREVNGTIIAFFLRS